MSKIKSRETELAMLRKAEIRRKVAAQQAQQSGDTGGQLSHLTGDNRLVSRGFYNKSGDAAKLDTLRQRVSDLKREKKGTPFIHCRRKDDHIVSVMEKAIPAEKRELNRKIKDLRKKKPEVRNICPMTGNVL